MAAFRIVQEALTNVTRHAGPATATVRVSYRERDLTVQVDDDGHGHPARNGAGGGKGIVGMRERATALGGDLEAGPGPGGGFRVRAGFRSLLDAQPEIEVVGEAGDGSAALRMAAELTPDLVLMDIRMPGVDGLAATCQIVVDQRLARVRVVILTTFALDE